MAGADERVDLLKELPPRELVLEQDVIVAVEHLELAPYVGWFIVFWATPVMTIGADHAPLRAKGGSRRREPPSHFEESRRLIRYDPPLGLGGISMATFVLVHGAWHGGWCWKRVRKLLQADGHDVFTPTLTGVGERSHQLARDVDLDTHIADVVNVIRWEELTDVVLCGHSYGGCVITGVADRIPERLRALVYLDAFILENGQGLHDVLPKEVAEAQARGAADAWRVPPITAEFFCVNLGDRAWVDAQCTPQPLATFKQRLRLDGAFPASKVTHILATGYEHSPFPPFHEIAKRKGWRTLTIDCGHDVMLDRPNELAAMLRDAAG